jgi:hypothetical protein
MSWYIKDNKLYLLSTEAVSGFGSFKYDSYCNLIDLNSNKMEKKKIGNGQASATRTICAHATLWFPNECVVSHLYYIKLFGVKKFNTILEKITYEDIDKLTAIK